MPEVLSAKASAHGERIAVEFEERSLRYGELDRAAHTLGRALAARGVEPGTLVVLVLPNRIETAIASFALARIGAVSIPANVFLKKDGLAYVFEQSGARIAIVDTSLTDRVREALGCRIDLDLVIVAGAAGGVLADRHIAFEEVMAGPLAELPPPPRPADPWAIFYTSGTTGPSKGVVLPQQMWATESHDAAATQRMSSASVSYTFLPLFHLNALVFGFGAAITLGTRAVIRSGVPKAGLLEDLTTTGATHSMLPLFFLQSMLAKPPSPADADFPLEVVGTMTIDDAARRAFEERFRAKISLGYGQTESGMLCVPTFDSKPGATGRPNPRYEFRIVDGEDRPVPPGVVGEVVARPRRPNEMMIGYHRMPEATVAAFRNLWLHTGDVGFLDGDGYFHFADRKKDMIKRRGENVSSYEVETELGRFPGVAAVAVVPFRGDIAVDEEVRAFVEPAPGGEVDPAALAMFAGSRLAYFMVPRYWDVVRELPRNAVGKVEKFKLRSEPLRETTFDLKSSGIVIER